MDKKTILEKKSALIRESILHAAETYFAQGGVDAVNIRQIARDIGYSATNIYKYFEHKDAIIHALISKRMHEIASSINEVDINQHHVIDAIKQAFTLHIDRVLVYGEHYKAVMLSSNPLFLERTSMLNPNTLERLPAHQKLIETIKIGIARGELKPVDPIMTAQILWSSVFGLLMRVIIEGYPDQTYIHKLLDYQLDTLLNGIAIPSNNVHNK